MADDLLHRYAEALKNAALDCPGDCGCSETECHNRAGIVWAGTAQKGSPDEETWVEGTTKAIAQVLAAVRDEELEKLRAQVADYVSSICWDTTCLGCAKTLDRCYEADMRRGQAEAKLARVRELHHIHRCQTDGHVLARTPNPCVNDGLCQGCGAVECRTLAALDDSQEGK